MTEVTAKAAKTKKKAGCTASKEVRRQQLIEATIESIGKFGVSATTFPDHIDLSGVPVPLA